MKNLSRSFWRLRLSNAVKQTRQKQNEDVLCLLMHIVFAPEFQPAFDFSLSLASQYSTSNSFEQLGYYYPPGATFSPPPDESNI